MGECPICLQESEPGNKAFIDGCYHSFCYPCILQWSEAMIQVASRRRVESSVFLRCPLCKSHYDALIHNVMGLQEQQVIFSRHCLLNGGCGRPILTPAQIARRRVYSEADLGDIVSVTGGDCSKYLWDWIERELQAVMLDEEVKVVAHFVKGTVERLHSGDLCGIARRGGMDCEGISRAVEPYLFEKSYRFAWEMQKYLASGLRIDAYDRFVENNEEDSDDEDL